MTHDTTAGLPSPAIAKILQHLFYLKSRFKVGVPENIAVLKERLDEIIPEGKMGDINRYDLFYSIGIIFSSQPEPITMGELSRALRMPLSTTTRIMDWLVKNDYARRLPDPEDRRVVRVTLTDTGNEMYHTINEFFLERIEQIMHPFTPQERETLLLLLSKLIDNLEKEA